MTSPTTFALRSALVFFVPLVVTLSFSGCVSAQHQLARNDGSDAVPLNLTERDASGAVTLRTIIDPKGPGSWKREAYWDEYVIAVTNNGKTTLRVESATLIDARGYAAQAGGDPWAIEDQSRGGLGSPAGASLVGSLPRRSVVPATITMAGMSTIYSSVGMKGPAIVYGAGAIGLPVLVLASDASEGEGRETIESEFRRRQLTLPAVIEAGTTAEGSFFFPVTAAPLQLALRCRSGSSVRTVVFDLTPFARLYHHDYAK